MPQSTLKYKSSPLLVGVNFRSQTGRCGLLFSAPATSRSPILPSSSGTTLHFPGLFVSFLNLNPCSMFSAALSPRRFASRLLGLSERWVGLLVRVDGPRRNDSSLATRWSRGGCRATGLPCVETNCAARGKDGFVACLASEAERGMGG